MQRTTVWHALPCRLPSSPTPAPVLSFPALRRSAVTSASYAPPPLPHPVLRPPRPFAQAVRTPCRRPTPVHAGEEVPAGRVLDARVHPLSHRLEGLPLAAYGVKLLPPSVKVPKEREQGGTGRVGWHRCGEHNGTLLQDKAWSFLIGSMQSKASRQECVGGCLS